MVVSQVAADVQELQGGNIILAMDGQLMEEFADTKGIIVDSRYDSSAFYPYLLGEYIIPEPTQFAVMTFPNRVRPGSFFCFDNLLTGAGVMNTMGDNKKVPPYNGKVILLMDEESMSQSKFIIMALRQSPNATVDGSPSIGADGNIVKLSLPGNITMSFV